MAWFGPRLTVNHRKCGARRAGEADGVVEFGVGKVIDRRRFDLELTIEHPRQDREIGRRAGARQQLRRLVPVVFEEDRQRRPMRHAAPRSGPPAQVAGTEAPVGVAGGGRGGGGGGQGGLARRA